MLSKSMAIANIVDRAFETSQNAAKGVHTFNQPRSQAIATTMGIDPISSDICRVRLSLKNGNWADTNDLLLAVANTLGDGIIPVEGSFRRISPQDNVVVGLVTRGLATMSVNEGEFNQRFSQVAHNVLMDNEDQSVWNLVSKGGGTVSLARQLDEDLEDLVAIARSRNSHNKLSHDVEIVQANTAGYARFYNTVTKTMDHGYVCGTEADGNIVVASRTLQDLVDVDPRLVVTCSNIHVDEGEYAIHEKLHRGGVKCPAHLITAMLSQRSDINPFARNYVAANVTETEQPLDPQSVSYDNMRNYYKQMFAYSPEYYSMFEKLIDESGF